MGEELQGVRGRDGDQAQAQGAGRHATRYYIMYIYFTYMLYMFVGDT